MTKLTDTLVLILKAERQARALRRRYGEKAEQQPVRAEREGHRIAEQEEDDEAAEHQRRHVFDQKMRHDGLLARRADQ